MTAAGEEEAVETGSGDMLMDEHQLGLWGRPSVAMATVSIFSFNKSISETFLVFSLFF